MQAVLTKCMFVRVLFRRLELGHVDHDRDRRPTTNYDNNNSILIMSVSAINVYHNHYLSPVILTKTKLKLIWTTALRNRKQTSQIRKKAPYSNCRPIRTAYKCITINFQSDWDYVVKRNQQQQKQLQNSSCSEVFMATSEAQMSFTFDIPSL